MRTQPTPKTEALSVVLGGIRTSGFNFVRQKIPRPSLSGFSPAFRGSALAIQEYRGLEFMLAGPSETGKTWAALWLLDSLLKSTPKAQAGLVRKVAADIGPTVLVTYKRIIEYSGSGATPFGGEKPEWYDYPNGARLYVGGMDRPGKVLSGERDFIYVNQAEELTLEDWETLSTRTTGRGAVTKTPMLFGDCNPGPEDHWILKRELLKVFHSRHEDNPSLFDEEGNLTEQGERTMTKLNALTGIRRARLRDGKWVGAEGLFFEEWDEELHTCEPFPIPQDAPVWGALDIGRAHNTAWGGLTQIDDTIYLFAEHVRNNWPIAQHCKAIRRQLQIVGVNPARIKRTVAGHDAFLKRVDGEGKSPAELYEQALDPETREPIGIKLERATVDRIAGATHLLELLGNRELGIAPRLKIFCTCKRTIACMTRMVHDPHDAEDVLKVDADVNGEGGDDPYDMLRYGCMVKFHPAPSRPATAGPRQTASVRML
jgi:hypothetical protein